MVEPDGKNAKFAANFGQLKSGYEPGEVTYPLVGEHPIIKAILTGKRVQIADLRDDALYENRDPVRVQMVEVEGYRTLLLIPLVGKQDVRGVIALWRTEVAEFSVDEVALVETFAAQAVIAIENVQQFREVQSRLEREAATSAVLDVISRSRDDEQPVFDLIVKLAKELCGALFAGLVLGREGDELQHVVASENLSPEVLQLWKDGKYTMERGHSFSADAILERRVIALEDMGASHFHQEGDERYKVIVTDNGVRSNLIVPLILNGEGIGCLMLGRDEVRPYSADQVKLVETFAAQAVVAIENVRQFREVQERLKREAATTEVLHVISTSRDDTQPVFDAILKNAAQLCDAPMADLDLVDEDGEHLREVATIGPAERAIPSEKWVWRMDSDYLHVVAVREGGVAHIPDLRLSEKYRTGDAMAVAAVDVEKMRTGLVVPLRKAGQCMGCIVLFRQVQKAFSEDEIALVETFAAQAVIAIENVRQFREVQDRLKRESATAEVLHVISQSRDNEQPVFDIILDRARSLCEATHAGLLLATPSDPALQRAAASNEVEDVEQIFRGEGAPNDPDISYAAKAIRDGKTLHLADMGESELYKNGSPLVCGLVDEGRVRSVIFAPLMGEKSALGVMALFRREVRPFSENQIKLVETFASQAVIAIENVRQFKALESLNAELGERVDAQVGEIERMGKLKRFLPAAVADTVVSQGSEKLLSSHRALLGVLFCDIRGFTAFCETAEPEETIEVLQTYHEEMGKLINEFGAGVDHRMGDGIMVLFNDPVPCEDPAGDAIRLAIAMRTHMAELAKKWKKLGHRLGFGVGVSLGYATVGMVGYEGRYDYTASGTAVNLAARLCDRAEDGEILLSPRAQTAVEDEFATESAGEFDLKGMREPVEVFRLKHGF